MNEREPVMRRKFLELLAFSVVGLSVPAVAQAPDTPPAWASWKAKAAVDPIYGRVFLAVGRSGSTGPADWKSKEAEEAALQEMGQLLADWQEGALRCAKKASETVTKAKSNTGSGKLLDFSFESATTVSFYKDRVADRAYEGKVVVVLVRHELGHMVDGIRADPDRTEGLKEAVKTCGEKAFDALLK